MRSPFPHAPNKGATNDWITPRWVLDALGPFDLDPCASEGQPWPTAHRMIAPPDNGFTAEWEGRVWLNPPYGSEMYKWVERLVAHPYGGTALVFARFETVGFSAIWDTATAILIPKGRLTFHRPYTGEPGPGNAGGASVLIAYGASDAKRLESAKIDGVFMTAWRRTHAHPRQRHMSVQGEVE